MNKSSRRFSSFDIVAPLVVGASLAASAGIGASLAGSHDAEQAGSSSTSTLSFTVTIGGALVDVVGLKPCAAEDSSDCYWDANAQGNGKGRTFVDIAGSVYYVAE